MTAPASLYKLKLGFVALTDCAALVAAHKLGLDRELGLQFSLQRQPSWSAVRDKLMNGQLDAAHALYGLVYGMQLGMGSPQCDMAILMTLNQNGQGISLAPALAQQYRQGMSLREISRDLGRPLMLAHTFPTGTHAMWLYYWLAAQGIHPLRDARCVVIPPAQMDEAMQDGLLDGFCAGQPWHALAQRHAVASLVADSAAIWPDHPEKVVACRRELVQQQPALASRLVQTLLLASHWLDQPENHAQAAAWLAEDDYLAMSAALILQHWESTDVSPLRFCAAGQVNYPYLSDGLWFLQQYRRWGMWQGEGEQNVVAAVNQTALYQQAAQACGIPLPPDGMRHSVLMDGCHWPEQMDSAPSVGAALQFTH
ncbi:CmpA/NrtA family ABC transporter substrate-binding protein [Aquitalea aquatica]|uniref:ABC transporter substrate-binding protein n=1 Tax=Aquitalea aquatica TaxID=3044273 RepID=A0A838Y6W5_9NEIS|nr:CmpA/NrtA family ABC transporter substrate-binding protein [Aquitalea magnusonii]MBA4709122.1 ABC transporter substrate-binding protein [Aquitalea magnusonii]